ncbi:hypothetical protein WEB32_32680 [Streptomyces netropsis]|uniref:Secreted protein n=1 Tax=Streptomyces netropsis TaxID=55404 RepID=A0A7W7L8G2_STRNE|nr:hypothetical protein [Streptomyces netropsis]MBB4885505.1 hypothetical protein [Streptomyces netropsis]
MNRFRRTLSTLAATILLSGAGTALASPAHADSTDDSPQVLVSTQQCVDGGGRIRQIFWIPPMYMCVGGRHNGEPITSW